MKPSVIPVVGFVSLCTASLIPLQGLKHFPEPNHLIPRDQYPHIALAPFKRQAVDTGVTPGGSVSQTNNPPSTTPAETTTTPPKPDTTTPTTTSSPTSTTQPSSNPASQTQPTTTSTPPTANTSQPTSGPKPTPPPVLTSITQQVTSTNEQGFVTVIQFVTNVPTSSSSSAKPSATASSDGDSGLGTKSIVGMAVAGGLFGLGLIGFIYWKVSKKRFAGFDGDDGDAIKWPELKDANAMQPLPPRPTGSVGGDTASEFDHRLDSQSVRSPYAYDNQSVVSSTADLTRPPVDYASNDPYGVPPPAQPYYDDPNATGYAPDSNRPGYYDPYRGPVPTSLDGHSSGHYRGGSIDPMGRTSPGPNAAFGGIPSRSASPAMTVSRSTSPGPHMAYGGGRSTSPGPNMAYRSASPGPAMAYAPNRSTSPGPNMAYGTGRAPSPGPGLAYGGQPRSQSPGPNYAYGGAEAR